MANVSIWNDVTTGINSAGSDSPVELGVKFFSDVVGEIIGIQFYKESKNTGTHVGNLWNASGTLLATGTFTKETASGWQQMNFSSPVAITTGAIYTASYHTTIGYYGDTRPYFTKEYNNGYLHVPINGGVYYYSSKSIFPTKVYNSSNYWVDILFAPNSSVVTGVGSDHGISTVLGVSTEVTIVNETPAPNSINIPINTSIIATLNEKPNSYTFILTDPNNNVIASTVTYNNLILTLTPNASLNYDTVYTVNLEVM